MKTTTYTKVCELSGLKYIETVKKERVLKNNEYYALMVTDSSESPHTKGVDVYSHTHLVGVERPNKDMGCYISKDFNSRNSSYRGNTIIVEVDNPDKFTLLGEGKKIFFDNDYTLLDRESNLISETIWSIDTAGGSLNPKNGDAEIMIEGEIIEGEPYHLIVRDKSEGESFVACNNLPRHLQVKIAKQYNLKF